MRKFRYDANATQTSVALDGIRLTSSLYASIPFFLGVGCLFFYRINKQLNIQITDELNERRKMLDPVKGAFEPTILAEAP